MKCKDCFWFSDITVNCCERDGSDPCDPEHEACQEYEPQELLKEDFKDDWQTAD